MVRLILAAALLLATPFIHAQELRKGTLVGTHVLTVKLQPGATMEQVVSFYQSKYIPAVEQSRPGWKGYLLRSVRGEKHEGLGLLLVIRSAAERDKYYNADGSDSELGKQSVAKLQALADELAKLATVTNTYTDWLVN